MEQSSRRHLITYAWWMHHSAVDWKCFPFWWIQNTFSSITLSPPPPRRWWPTLLIEVSERLGHAWTCLDMHGHAWNLCLFRQTVKKKVGQTYVTGASGQGPPMWQVAGGSGSWQVACGRRVYSWCYLPRCPLSPPLLRSLSFSLVVCSALSKHVTGMPRLRDVWARTGSSDTWNETEWNGINWTGLDWAQTVQSEEKRGGTSSYICGR